MEYGLEWTVDSLRDLELLDRVMADRITRKVLWFSIQSNPLRHAEPLTGVYRGIYRFRVADYRILFEKNQQGQLIVLMVLRVKHRREVYRR